MKQLISGLLKKHIILEEIEGRIKLQAGNSTISEEEKVLLNSHKPEVLDFLDKRKIACLSFAQERLWFVSQLGLSTQYHLPGFFVIENTFDEEAFCKAIKFLITRHESFRTGFNTIDGEVYQEVFQAAELPYSFIDISNLEGDIKESRIKEIKEEFIEKEFDLSKPPLLRSLVVMLSENKFLIGLNMHHIISDGWSIMILAKELAALYQGFKSGKEVELPGLKMQYSDYAVWTRQNYEGDSFTDEIKYWKEQLNGFENLELPYDYHKPEFSTGKGNTVSVHLDGSTMNDLKANISVPGASSFTFLMASVYILLHKYSGQYNFCLGMPVSNRNDQDIERIIGYFVNTLAIKVNGADHLGFTVKNLVTTISEKIIEGQDHQKLPFERIVEVLQPERNISSNPIFQVIVNASEGFVEGNSQKTDFKVDDFESTTAKFDLTFSIDEIPEHNGFNLSLEYSSDLFNQKTAQKMIGHLRLIMTNLSAYSDKPFIEISLLKSDDGKRLLDLGQSKSDFKQAGCLHQQMEKVALTYPDRIAVLASDMNLTYGELNAKTEQLAIYLQSTGVGKNDLIAICMKNSAQLIISLYGILKTGAAYVPIDPDYPEERINYILKDSQVKVLITNNESIEFISGNGQISKIINIDTEKNEIASADGILKHEYDLSDIAYIIYTSGSTGKPKGTIITHSNTGHITNPEFLNLLPDDKILQISNFAFDGSVFEIFATLSNGAQLAIIKKDKDFNVEDVVQFIADQQVTVSFMTTALLNAIIDRSPEALLSFRKILFGGEVASVTHINKALKILGGDKLIHVYGPTETTVFATLYPIIEKEFARTVPIGKAMAGTELYVLDKSHQLVPEGLPGELYIGGSGVCKGYLSSIQTAEKFMDNPFKPGDRLYATGDLVKWNEKGQLEFISRIDNQVKIRGYRVELDEIEQVLNHLDGINSSAIIARDVNGVKQLIAYYTGSQTDSDQILQQISLKLPSFMIPVVITKLDEIPVTANGKTNRKLLEKYEIDNSTSGKYCEPVTQIQIELVKIWEKLLKVERIGTKDNFFKLGGHSLLITALITEIQNHYKIKLPLKEVFNKPILENIATMIEKSVASDELELTKFDRPKKIPLSYTQERLWFLDKMGLGHQYHIPAILEINGVLDVDIVEKSFKYLVDRHESFRTVFEEEDGVPYQKILEDQDFQLLFEDISGLSTEQREKTLKRSIYTFVNNPFDLERGPLLRLAIFKMAENQYAFAINMHHIISDGWSISILTKEFATVYTQLKNGDEPLLEELPIQYADYTLWQKKTLNGEQLTRDIDHWVNHLKDSEDLSMPTDFNRPVKLSGRGGQVEMDLKSAVCIQLSEFAKSRGKSSFSVLLSAMFALLHYYTRQNSINIGMPMANRNMQELGGIIGFFANTVITRMKFDSSMTFDQLIEVVSKELIRGQEYQQIPFEKIVEAVNPSRDQSRTPLFQVMASYMNLIDSSNEGMGELDIKSIESEYLQVKFDLKFSFSESPDGNINLIIEYSEDLYKQSSIENMIKQYEKLLSTILSSPNNVLAEASLISETEERQLVIENNDNAIPYQSDKCIHQIFADKASRFPDRIAVKDGEKALTYDQFNSETDKLAAYIISKGIKSNDLVAICMDRSYHLMISLMAVLKAGAAYVPIGLENPDDRIIFMLEDSEASLILADAKSESRIKSISGIGHEKITIVNDQLLESINSFKGATLDVQSKPDDLAYVIYTSGSTGKPKGVLVPHQGLVNYTNVVANNYLFLSIDIDRLQFAFYGNFSFDASAITFITPLISGGTCHVFNGDESQQELVKRIFEDDEINAIKLTPSHLKLLIDTDFKPSATKKMVIIGGESLSAKNVEIILSRGVNIFVVNQYGPTETTIGCTAHLYDSSNRYNQDVFIGKPLANCKAYVLDENKKPLPCGIPGELYIGGVGVSKGYLKRPELTAEKFVDNPFIPGIKFYKTGDLVRWLSNGEIEFLGRIDQQVKIRGYRVELGEIESAIASLEKVNDASVIYKKQSDDHLLIAYYTASEDIEMTELKAFLSKSLPEYMIPVHFTRIDEIPLTANGKSDKKLLESKDVTLISSASYEAANNEVEASLVIIWEDLLNVENIGINDNFFELGGHSLLATRIISRINTKFNTNLPVGTIFTADNIKALALSIDSNEKSDLPVLGVIARPENIPLSYTQERLWFLNELGQGDQYLMPHIYEVDGNIRIDFLQQAIDLLVQRHESLRTYFRNDNGTPYQEVDTNLRIPINYVRLVDLQAEEKEQRIQEIIGRFSRDSFHMEYGPLIRFVLIEKAKNQYIFGFCIHHIISDGWSGGVFRSELGWFYENLLKRTDPTIPDLKVQYIDYTLWQREVLNTEKLEKELLYWKNHLDGYQDLAMPHDFPRPLEMTGAGKLVSKTYNRALSQQVAKFSNEQSVTVFNSLTAAVYVLLHVYSGQDDITVGMPIANRMNSDLEGIIGFFANTVVSRIQMDRDENFIQLMEKVKAESIKSQDHQNVPFEKIVDTVQPERELSKTPLFQVLVNYLVNRTKSTESGSLNMKPFSHEHDSSKFDLHFSFFENADGIISLSIEYSTELFEEQTIQKMAGQIETILNVLVNNPQKKLSSISLLTEEEQNELLRLSGSVNNKEHQTIHSLIDDICKRKGDSIAVEIDGKSLTYQSLAERSDRLAGKLYQGGVRKNDLVAICMDRSLEMVVSMVAVLKAGGGYVPIDHEFPADRKQYILKDSKVKQLISKSDIASEFESNDVELIILDDLQAFDEIASTPFETHNDATGISYVIYTSGSTGKPKGVLQTHQTISNLVAWQNEQYGQAAHSRKVSQFASIGFDVSVQEIFFSLISGDTLVMISEELKLNPTGLLSFICEKQIDINYLPTAYLDYFCLEANRSQNELDFSSLKRIIVAGEALKITDEIRKFFISNPGIALENQYGPSETHVVTALTLPENPHKWPFMPSIGSPVANTTAYLLDDQMKLVPRGAIGELYFGGAGLADSYLANKELTEEKFVTNPYSGERLYKTGDLAKWTLDQNLQFIGRTDNQAKIRGYRIEPGEIEARLTTHEAVSQASVIVKSIQGNNYLIAFYVAESDIEQDLLRKHLSVELPDYMIPSAFERIEKIPLTHNGKTDIRKLANLQIDFTKGREYVAPVNEVEERLAEIWGGLLNVEKVSVTDNFFEIGGHSLLATRLISRINHEFKIEMHLSTLFKQPTIQGCAEQISKMDLLEEDNSLSSFMEQEDELTF